MCTKSKPVRNTSQKKAALACKPFLNVQCVM